MAKEALIKAMDKFFGKDEQRNDRVNAKIMKKSDKKLSEFIIRSTKLFSAHIDLYEKKGEFSFKNKSQIKFKEHVLNFECQLSISNLKLIA